MTNRRQHTIPQFYLNRFLSPGYVYKRGVKSARRVNSPKHVADRPDYYGKEEPGRPTIDAINRKMENDGAPALQRLIECPETINFDDWVNLSWLLANLWIRTPAQIVSTLFTEREIYSQVRSILEPVALKVREGVVDIPTTSNFNKSGSSRRYTLEQIQKIDDDLKVKDAYLSTAAGLFKQLPAIAKYIQGLHFFLLCAPDGKHFVTSDRPFGLRSMLTGSRVGVGLANSDMMALIPLCPTTVLVIMHGESGCISEAKATTEHVDFLNIEMVRFADREVYSRFESQEAHDWMKGTGRWRS